MTDRRDALHAALSFAVSELDAVHGPDDTGRMCVTCGAADGSWPCVSRMVTDDLRGLIEGDAS